MSKEKLIVVDSSVNPEYPIREHDVVINGSVKSLVFKYGETMEVDYEIGMKFVGKEGFEVYSAESKEAILPPAKMDEGVRMRIGAEEVVAKYTELELGALKVRAAGLKGGEKFLNGEHTKIDIIEFLKNGAENNEKPVEVDVEFNEEGVDLEEERPEEVTSEEYKPDEEQHPVDNDHVEEGSEKFEEPAEEDGEEGETAPAEDDAEATEEQTETDADEEAEEEKAPNSLPPLGKK